VGGGRQLVYRRGEDPWRNCESWPAPNVVVEVAADAVRQFGQVRWILIWAPGEMPGTLGCAGAEVQVGAHSRSPLATNSLLDPTRLGRSLVHTNDDLEEVVARWPGADHVYTQLSPGSSRGKWTREPAGRLVARVSRVQGTSVT
jgi:hypothetical protein